MVYTYNGLLAWKRNEILTHAAMWMNVEDIMLSERSQTQRDKYCIIHSHELSRMGKFIDIECRIGVTRG